MSDSGRIEELRRRVQSDPASIAFAALAEEYRRAGQYEDAIATCRAGLQRHPAYLSAHVTLGRALIEIGKYDEARVELEQVLRIAPENLAAIRALAEIHDRHGEPRASGGGVHVATAAAPAPAPASAPARAVAPVPVPRTTRSEPAAAIPLSRTNPVPPAPAQVPVNDVVIQRTEPAPTDPLTWDLPIAPAERPRITLESPPDADPVLAGLEAFLAAITRARRGLDQRDGMIPS